MSYQLVYALLFLTLFAGCKNESGEIKPLKKATFAISSEVKSIDPRKARDLKSATISRLLFEGLFTLDEQLNPLPALAESYRVSEDGKTYAFTLKEANWSDGSSVTAFDFVYTYKSMLDPSFPAPNAYQLFVIKGAKEAKFSEGALDDVMVYAIDDRTLVIELEKRVPHFLSLLSTHPFFPIQEKSDRKNGEITVFNGPFVLKVNEPMSELIVSKNPTYRNQETVHLDEVALKILDERAAYHLFQSKDATLIGSPLSALPLESLPKLKAENLLRQQDAVATWFLRVNTNDEILKSIPFRKSIAHAIDRRELIDYVTKGGEKEARSLVPSLFHLHSQSDLPPYDPELAKTFYKEATSQNEESAQRITLVFGQGEKQKRIAQALKSQIEHVLPLKIDLLSQESQTLFTRLQEGKYQLALGSWYADFADPINFLEIFMSKESSTNNTGFEDEIFIEKINASIDAKDPIQRNQALKEAEERLLDVMPIIPLFHPTFLFVSDPLLQNIHFSPLGYLDLKEAKLSE